MLAMPQLPDGYTAHAATDADVPALIDLFTAVERFEYGHSADAYSPEFVASWLKDAAATVVIPGPDGTLAAYAALMDHGSGKLDTDVYVHPDHHGHGLGTALLRWLEARGAERIERQPPEARVMLNVGGNGRNPAYRRLLETQGYTYERGFYRMRIDLDAPPSAPEWPAGIVARPAVGGQDERAVFQTVEDSFADHWGRVPSTFEEWLHRWERYRFDPALWHLALAGEQIAGFSLCNVEPDGKGDVGTLGVLRPWRKQGLGMALLRHSFGEFWRRGIHAVILGVDATNPTGAVRLYEAAGMRVDSEFALYLRELRPGVDLRTQGRA